MDKIKKIIFYLIVLPLWIIVAINIRHIYKNYFKSWFFTKRGDFANLCRASHYNYSDGVVLCYYSKKVYGKHMKELILPEKDILGQVMGGFDSDIALGFLYPSQVSYRKYDFQLIEQEFEYFRKNSYLKYFYPAKKNRYQFIDINKMDLKGHEFAVFKYYDNILVLPFRFREHIKF